MEGEEIEKSYNHIAFKIDESDYEVYLKSFTRALLERRTYGISKK